MPTRSLSTWPLRLLRALLLVLVAWVVVPGAHAQRLSEDPVPRVQVILAFKQKSTKRSPPTDNDLARKWGQELEKSLASVTTLPDMVRTLALQEWADVIVETENPWPEIRKQRRTQHDDLKKRAADLVRRYLESNDPPQQLGTLAVLRVTADNLRTNYRFRTGEEALTEEQLKALEKAEEERKKDPKAEVPDIPVNLGFAYRRALQRFAPDVAKLVTSPASTEEVRGAAIITLGRLQASPELVAQVYTQVLQTGTLESRRAVSESVVSMVRLALTVEDISVDLEKAVKALKQGYPVLGVGLRDADYLVRRRMADSLFEATKFLAKEIRPSPPLFSDEKGGTVTPQDLIDTRTQKVKYVKTLIAELNVLGEQLAAASQDSDTIVRALVMAAADSLAVVRSVLAAEAVNPGRKGGRVAGPPAGGGVTLLAPRPLAAPAPVVPVVYLTRPVAQDKDKQPEQIDPVHAGVVATMPALRRALTDPNIRVRLFALDALEAVGDRGAVQGEPGPGAPLLHQEMHAAIPDLVKALSDRDRFVRWAAARVLNAWATAFARLGQYPLEPNTVVPALACLLRDSDTNVRIAAVRAIGSYQFLATAALPALIDNLRNADVEVRGEVIPTLLAIGQGALPAIPALIENLANADPRIRRRSAEALGRFGTAASAALPTLEKMTFDTDRDVRQAVAGALLRIRP